MNVNIPLFHYLNSEERYIGMKRRKKLSNNKGKFRNRKNWFQLLYAKTQNYSYARWLYLHTELDFSYHDADSILVDELTIIFINHKLNRSEINQLALDDDPNIQRAAITILKSP